MALPFIFRSLIHFNFYVCWQESSFFFCIRICRCPSTVCPYASTTLFSFFLIDVQQIYNVVPIPAVQQRDSVRQIQTFVFFSMMVYPRILHMISGSIQQDLVAYPSYIQQFTSANPRFPIHPSLISPSPWQPQVCSLCL